MPRLYFDPDTGWWAFPLEDEPAPIAWIGERERGPDNPPPPPFLPRDMHDLFRAPDSPAPGEPGPGFENAGPYVAEAERGTWYEAAQAFARDEIEPLREGAFDPLAYLTPNGAACTVPSSHPPPGTLIGFPGTGTHSRSSPPNNWQSDEAVDVWLYPGTVVRACAAGVVSMSYGYGYSGPPSSRFGGSRLHIEHAGMISFYQHLERITVRRGAHVRRGQAIGRSGFGNCVPHLHFAVTPPRDPAAYARVTYDASAPPNPPPPPREPTEPPPPIPRRTVETSWHNLMVAIGPDRRKYRQRITKARRVAKRALD